MWLFTILYKSIEDGQNESGGRRRTLAGFAAWVLAGAAFVSGFDAVAKDGLATGGLSFRDFAIPDKGASFSGGHSDRVGGPNQVPSRVLAIEADKGLARIRFDSIRVSVALPLGWAATEDWERGVAYSGDRRYRVIVWRVDFAFEGVKDAEHYAATKSGTIRARRPQIQTQVRRLGDGSFLIAYENAPPAQGDGGSPRVVFDLLTANPRNAKEGVLLTLGVPASDAERGLSLLALIRDKMEISW